MGKRYMLRWWENYEGVMQFMSLFHSVVESQPTSAFDLLQPLQAYGSFPPLLVEHLSRSAVCHETIPITITLQLMYIIFLLFQDIFSLFQNLMYVNYLSEGNM